MALGTLSYTLNDSFKLLGYFSINQFNPNNKDLIPGIFSFNKGICTLEVFNNFYKPSANGNISFPITSSNDGLIFGILEDGIRIKINKYLSQNFTQHFPGFPKSSFLIYNYDMYSPISNPHSSWTFNPNYLLLRFNNLFNWIRELPNADKKLATIQLDNDTFNIFIQSYETSQQVEMEKIQIIKSPVLKISWDDTFKQSAVNCLISKLTNLLTLLTDSVFQITQVQYIKELGNSLRETRNSFVRSDIDPNIKFTLNPALIIVYHQIEDHFEKVLQTYLNLTKSNSSYPLLQSLLLFLNSNQNDNSNLLNYINSIETAFKNKHYSSNGKKISSLKGKIKFFMGEIPEDLLDKMFNQQSDREAFIRSLVDTRDYLVHGDKASSDYLLDQLGINVALEKLHLLVYVYVLLDLKVPKDLVIKNFSIPYAQAGKPHQFLK